MRYAGGRGGSEDLCAGGILFQLDFLAGLGNLGISQQVGIGFGCDCRRELQYFRMMTRGKVNLFLEGGEGWMLQGIQNV